MLLLDCLKCLPKEVCNPVEDCGPAKHEVPVRWIVFVSGLVNIEEIQGSIAVEIGRRGGKATDGAFAPRASYKEALSVASRDYQRNHSMSNPAFARYINMLHGLEMSRLLTCHSGDLVQRPDVISHPRLHSRRNAQRLVDPGEVIVHEVERQRRLVIVHLL